MEKTKARELRASPLIETALSVAVVAPRMSRDDMLGFCEKSAPGFLKWREIEERMMVFSFTDKPSVDDKKAWSGVQFRKDDNLVLTLKNERESVVFTFSVLRPYTSWSVLHGHAKPILDAFLSLVQSPDIARVGIRSINRLFAPYVNCPMTDIVKTIPPDVVGLQNPSVYEFSYQDTIYYPRFNLFSTVRRFSQQVPNDPRFAVVLDIDVFTPPDKKFRIDELSSLTDKIVELKDMVFFGTIGDKCLEACS